MQENCWESLEPQSKPDKSIKSTVEIILNNKTANLLLGENSLQIQKSHADLTIEIKYQQIINVKRSKTGPGICINYLTQTSEFLLKLKKLKFAVSSESEKLSKNINKNIKNFTCNRIKSLFVCIDSIGDRCAVNGNEVFEKQIKPFLIEFKISFEKTEIQSFKDIDEIEDHFDSIKQFNGILLISGDETASSIISNIMNYCQVKSRNVKEIPIPFGIIPIGYHNDISNSIWGSGNVENALLNIILGNSFQADILSISSRISKSKVWGFNFQYGYYNIYEKCRLDNHSDKESNLVKKAFKNLIDVECHIKFTPSESMTGHPKDDQKCDINCSKCNVGKPQITNIPVYNLDASMNSNFSDVADTDANEKNILSKYKWIILNSIPCLSDLMGHEFTPSCHFNDGTADLVLVRCKKKNDLKKILKLLESDGSYLSHSKVYSERIKEVSIFLNSDSLCSEVIKSVTMTDFMDSGEIVIFDQHSSSSSSDEDDQISNEIQEKPNQNDSTNNKKKKAHKILQPIVKAYKEMTKTTYADTNENYRKPNMLESERDRIRKEEKKKKKLEKLNSKRPTWMLDYNFLKDVNGDILIKVYSGLVSFYGKAVKIF